MPRVVVGREMWLILDERERVDFIDEKEGQHVQNMVRPPNGYLPPNQIGCVNVGRYLCSGSIVGSGHYVLLCVAVNYYVLP